VDGDEVPQAYLAAPSDRPVGAAFSVRKLVAFDRIHLVAGETKNVVMHVPLRQLQYWSIANRDWMTPPGTRRLSVGTSSRDLRLTQSFN